MKINKIVKTYEEVVEVFKAVVGKRKQINEPLIFKVEPLLNRRTEPQLKAYWVLIHSCLNYMNSKGNNFDEKQVDCYFKLESGHYVEIDGVKVPRSISNSSNTTKDEMENLLMTILDFGFRNEIENCRLDKKEYDELISFYKNNTVDNVLNAFEGSKLITSDKDINVPTKTKEENDK